MQSHLKAETWGGIHTIRECASRNDRNFPVLTRKGNCKYSDTIVTKENKDLI